MAIKKLLTFALPLLLLSNAAVNGMRRPVQYQDFTQALIELRNRPTDQNTINQLIALFDQLNNTNKKRANADATKVLGRSVESLRAEQTRKPTTQPTGQTAAQKAAAQRAAQQLAQQQAQAKAAAAALAKATANAQAKQTAADRAAKAAAEAEAKRAAAEARTRAEQEAAAKRAAAQAEARARAEAEAKRIAAEKAAREAAEAEAKRAAAEAETKRLEQERLATEAKRIADQAEEDRLAGLGLQAIRIELANLGNFANEEKSRLALRGIARALASNQADADYNTVLKRFNDRIDNLIARGFNLADLRIAAAVVVVQPAADLTMDQIKAVFPVDANFADAATARKNLEQVRKSLLKLNSHADYPAMVATLNGQIDYLAGAEGFNNLADLKI